MSDLKHCCCDECYAIWKKTGQTKSENCPAFQAKVDAYAKRTKLAPEDIEWKGWGQPVPVSSQMSNLK